MAIVSYIQKILLSINNYKLFILPLSLVFLSFFGMQYFNQTTNSFALLILFFLLAIYLIILTITDKKLTDTQYCIILYLISITLIQLFAFRSNHIIGRDSHLEFILFQDVLNTQHIGQISYGPLDACLSISTLPALVQVITNINPELLFKILFPLIFSIAPIIVFLISRNFLDNRYSFLSALFFIAQQYFIRTTSLARINIAILFFLLGIYIIFKDKQSNPIKFLSILFICSIVFSHYSTAYIVLGILILSYIIIKIIKNFNCDKNWKNLSLLKGNNVKISIFVLFIYISVLFFWYGLMLVDPMDVGIKIISRSINNLDKFFLIESRDKDVTQAFFLPEGQFTGIYNPVSIKFFLNWIVYILIFFGIIGILLTASKIINNFFNKYCILPDGTKFSIEYIVVSIMGLTFLIIALVLPFVSTTYDIGRTIFVSIGLLSPFFIVGCIILFNILKVFFKKITSEDNFVTNHNNNQQMSMRICIVIIIIAYLFSNVGIIDYFANKPTLLLNSQGSEFESYYIFDQESSAAKWLGNYQSPSMLIVFFKRLGNRWISSQSGKSVSEVAYPSPQDFNDRNIDKVYQVYCFLIHGYEIEKYDFKKLTQDTNKIYNGGYNAMIYS